MTRFLILQSSFLGDVVLSTAIVEKIHQYFPDAHIDFFVRKGNESLLANNPHLRNLLVWDKKNRKLRNLLKLARQVRKEHYDVLINVHRGMTTGFVSFYSGAKSIRGFKKNPFSRFYNESFPHVFSKPKDAHYIHEVERNQQLIADITDGNSAKPAIYPSEKDFETVKEYTSMPYICMAPSSVWATKRFPEERWVELIHALPQNYSIFLLGAKEDIAMADRILLASSQSNVYNLSGQLSMMQSAALMKGAVMNYTNDSGPMHFASATNAPQTAIFCSTHPCFGFGPLSDQRMVVQVEDLYCKPCGIHGYPKCPEGHFRCASEIKISALLWWISPQI